MDEKSGLAEAKRGSTVQQQQYDNPTIILLYPEIAQQISDLLPLARAGGATKTERPKPTATPGEMGKKYCFRSFCRVTALQRGL